MTSRWLVVALAFSLARTPQAAAEPSGRDVYYKAVAALAANHLDEALQLSMRAAAMPGPEKVAAKFLYGDALRLSGELARAREVFAALREKTTGTQRARAESKLADVTRELAEQAKSGPPSPVAEDTTAGDLPAKVKYADALARQGSHARAKDLYVALRKRATGELRREITAKLAAENRALKLPESDGAD